MEGMPKLWQFVDAIVDAARGGEVAFGNLNYDALLMAALCNKYEHQLAALTNGRLDSAAIEVVPDWPM